MKIKEIFLEAERLKHDRVVIVFFTGLVLFSALLLSFGIIDCNNYLKEKKEFLEFEKKCVEHLVVW